jgi:hypothetical protein
VWCPNCVENFSLTQTLPHTNPPSHKPSLTSSRRRGKTSSRARGSFPLRVHLFGHSHFSHTQGEGKLPLGREEVFPCVFTFIYILPTLRHNTRSEKNLLNAFSYPLPTLRHRRGKTSSRARGSFPLRTHLHFATRNPHTKHKKKGKLPLGREEVF